MRQLALAVLVFALSLGAADVTGKWSGTLKPDGEGDQPLYVVLKQDGGKLSGSGGPTSDHQFPFESGKVDGDRLTFEVPVAGGGGNGSFRFDLQLKGEELTGAVEATMGGEKRSAKVSLKRAAS